jgi:peptide/nickel transport system ATP-binding protein
VRDQPGATPLLEVRGLAMHFPITEGMVFTRKVADVKAVDGIDFSIQRGETLGLVGESGCGKTTTSRCVLRAVTPTAGQILFRTAEGPVLDVATLARRQLRPLRRQMQMIFQDPFSSLNPRRTLLDIVAEPLVANRVGDRTERIERVAELLRLVGLRPEYMRRYPHAFSGGQRQRVGIARALALNPALVVADEPVSALDVSVQAQILNLMRELQREHDLTYVFISHDLSVVRYISTTIGVMYLGKLVEIGPAEQVYSSPAHPYTRGLIDTIPVADPERELRKERDGVRGELPSAINPPSGCRFRTRCPLATQTCADEAPPMQRFSEQGHQAACHYPLQPPIPQSGSSAH